MRDFIVGTAGHIDHGKTTLLKALTGIDADRLAEEKRRGITIDIGFAHLETGDFRIGFVDVPGHEKFVKNMLAGIGGIQFVLLVVAADESIMPQTVEHFQICKLLEIPDGLVVLTKKNLVEEELLELVKEEVADLVAGSFLEKSPVVAVDSVSEEGIDDLKKTLAERLARGAGSDGSRAENSIFRLPVDRVFSLRGFGTIVTGTPMAGKLQRDAPLAVYPGGKTGKVRGIQVFGKQVGEACAGQRTALNLSGFEKTDLERGVILAPPGAFAPSQIFDAALTLLPDAPAPLRQRSPVRFHHGSGEIMGRIHLLDRKELSPGESAVVRLRLERPTVACACDHFVLRRYSPMRTLGGGIILDNRPRKKLRKGDRGVARLEELRRLWETRPSDAAASFLRYYVEQAGHRGVPLQDLSSQSGLHHTAVLEILEQAEEIVIVPQDMPIALTRGQLLGLQQAVVDFLQRFHAENPLAAGASQEEVKRRFFDGAAATLFQFVLERLRSEGKVQSQGGSLRLKGSEIELTVSQTEIRQKILAHFQDEMPQAPTLSQIIENIGYPAAQVEEIFYYLLQSGELLRVSGDLVLSARQIEWLQTRVRETFEKKTAFGVAEFKDLFHITRKYAIPLLEFLDRQKVTRRAGDQRIVL